MILDANLRKTREMNVRHAYKTFIFCALVFLIVFCVSLLYSLLYVFDHKPVVINEICSNNFSLIQDNTGQYSDYIELYNPNDEPISLEGYFLSDDEKQLHKFSLESISIPPKGYYIVWPTSGTDSLESTSPGFGISKYGETIYLSNSNSGKIVDKVAIPELTYNTCYGRIEDGAAEWAKMSGTAGETNSEANLLMDISSAVPVFNAESGFYKEPFEVEITASEGDTIYYTLDGSIPTLGSYIYQTPIAIEDVSRKENIYASRTDLSVSKHHVPSFPVDKATVLRAVSYNARNNTISEVVTKVYFIGYDARPEYENFPVVSIVTDPDNLFDYESGIYGNGAALDQYKEAGGLQDGELLGSFTDQEGSVHYLYMASNAFNDGREWERKVTLTYFDSLHDLCFEQNVGIRISGNSTRTSPQKSLSIYGRDIYDEGARLPYEFFPGNVYSTIKLRNGGGRNGTVMITDAFVEELAEGRNVSIQRSTPCILFLNGEYWGIYNIRERYKEEFLNNHFGVRNNNVWIMDGDVGRVGDGAARNAYDFMLSMLIDCDLFYDDVYAMICDIIDVQSLIDFCCINLYVNNKDINFEQNTALWRTIEPEENAYGDGKWRWMLFDMDDCLESNNEISWMVDHPLLNEPAILSLMDNEQFRKQFCITFMDIANTIYAYDTVHEKLIQWEDIYKEQVVKNNIRFFDESFNEETYHGYITEMDDFFKNRFPFAMESLAYTFGLSGKLETITVESNISEGGTITVNTAHLNDCERWSGQYFTDYPLTFTADAREGYRFVRWEGDINSQESTVVIELPDGGFNLKAIFEKCEM